jgi:porin
MILKTNVRCFVYMLTALLILAMTGAVCFADDPAASTADQGILPVPDYSGEIGARSNLTGDWGGVRQNWADRGVTMAFDWYQAYQDIIDGGFEEGSANSTNLDYRLNLDLMRMGLVPGALVKVRGQSHFGDTVNDKSGVLLPVNMYSAFPISSDGDGDVDFAITELNWFQFLSDQFGLLAGKITTLATTNEFMGGEGRSQFMNFQLSFSAAIAQLTPYSTLAVSAIWLPSPSWSVSTTLMNLEDASTTSGFDDIGDGTTWATTADYRAGLNKLPGGGSISFYYGFDADFAKIRGLNIDPGNGEASRESKSDSWGLSWNGWQYIFVENDTGEVDPGNGRQDLEGLGLFAQVGIADEDTNPITWSFSIGLSGRGTIPGRDADTWGVGYYYNDLHMGLEVYYDISLFGWAFLTLDAQWNKSAFQSIDNSTIIGARLNVSF